MTDGPSREDIDARFRELVARFDEPAAPDPRSGRPAPPTIPTEPAAPPVPAQWRMPTDDAAHVLDDHEGFVPPQPAPLPTGDPLFWATVGGLVAGPVWLLYLYFFDRYARGIWWALAAGTFFAGVVLLLWRQPASRADLDPDDDGAVL